MYIWVVVRSRWPVVVSEPNTPALHLLLQDSVLLDQVGDDIGLMSVHEA